MFGYVVANMDKLTEEQKEIYRSYYCGLCRSLKKQYGNFGRLTLNYDMTFMVLLLADLMDPKTQLHTGRCVVHPCKEKKMAENEIIDYGASMNILLAYYNLLDDWRDEQKTAAKTAANRLKRFIPAIEKRYPRQARAVKEQLEALAQEEKKHPQDLDTAANLSGKMLGQLFVYQKDFWAEDCYRFGEALGRFVYWMDAYEDLPKDQKKDRYNPMSLICKEPDYRQKVEEMLKNTLGECAIVLERLPLVEHLDILRNVLYSGIWSKFEQINQKEEEK
ncbi:MAG: hypothetical protein IJ333_00560 [Clostridia bacterium]|nr:hypothetical protein [Clostridia bacterium]